jgi:hypothetical protein
MKKKPIRILEERRKNGYIEISLFKTAKVYSFSLLTSIGNGGIGYPDIGPYRSYFQAKNAALHYILKYHHSALEKKMLSKFRLMEDLDQPYLFEEL